MVLVIETSEVVEVSLTQNDNLTLFIFCVSMKSTIQPSGSVAGREAKPKTRVQYQYEQL